MRKLLLPLILACAACTTDARSPSAAPQPMPTAKSAPTPDAGQAGTVGQIRSIIGAAGCTDSSQCRTLPLGARGCGGPEGYLPYSTANSSEATLQALGERYKKEREAQNARSGMVSDCRFMVDPGAVCQAGTCQLAPGGPQVR
jgi:hypothetical protein